jgi:hypothetical protein
MKLFALPENVINEAFALLQTLPFNEVVTLLPKIQQAQLVVDSTGNPVTLPDLTVAAPVDVTLVQEATSAQ